MWNVPRTDISQIPPTTAAKANCGRLRVRVRRSGLPFARAIGLSTAVGMMAAVVIAAGSLAVGTVAAGPPGMKAPRLSHINPDWNAVATDLNSIGAPTAPPTQARSEASASENQSTGAKSIADLNR